MIPPVPPAVPTSGFVVDSLAELEDLNSQTRAVIESTGGAAGITAGEIRTMAESFEETAHADEAPRG